MSRLLTKEDRDLVAKAHAIKAKKRKEAKAARPRQVAPIRTDRSDSALRERRPRLRDNGYLAFIRRLPCLATARRDGAVAFGCDAAHVRSSYPEPGWPHTGRGEKPDDVRTVPLTRAAHEEQHGQNERAWWSAMNLYPPAVCARLRHAYEAGEDGTSAILEIARWETDRG
jgi:hypothetical protein